MATSISVNKQSVSELLQTGRTKPFVIPEYQRPYAWTSEQVEELFEDIWEFATTTGGMNNNGTYFLGSIVSFENEKMEQEIIDGQQRLTSLFLLLRAIYTKLVNGDDSHTRAAQNYQKKIEPSIWREDNLTGEVNYSDILLTSKVIDNDGNNILRTILETGEANPKLNDNYTKNYLLFQKLYDEHCLHSPFRVYDFIYALLNQTILLPICADSQNTALTIFSTLNNRGLQLSDADIFKAQLYNNLEDSEKEDFISQWKMLDKEATEAKESIQQLFYYYMFYLRAKEGDVSSTTPGIRKYYTTDKSKRLFSCNIIDELRTLLNLWKVINVNQDIPGETWDNNQDIRKVLDTLTSYPNEFWKYPVVTYYLSHRNKENFDKEFLAFLNKLSGELMVRFLVFPTINAVKSDIMKLNAKIIADMHPDFNFKSIDKGILKERIVLPHRNIVRMLLKTYAYGHQDKLLPDNWQIEHILPQKWQSTFFTDVDDNVVNEMIEHIGNKTPFEKKLNIVASNGYFKEKQDKYMKSSVSVTNVLVANIESDWTLGNIAHRDEIISNEILTLLDKWDYEYDKNPNAEQLAMIEDFKKKGWI